VFRKRARSAYGRRSTYRRRAAFPKKRWTSRSRRLYNPRGTNPNQVIELKNVDYCASENMVAAGTAYTYPITFANAAFDPARVVDGDRALVVASTSPWNFVSQGSGSNQREGRKINCVKMLLKGSIILQVSSATQASQGSIVHCVVLLDTACNGAVPDLKNVFTSYGLAADAAATGFQGRHFWPSPNGVNRFRVLKHKIFRPRPTIAMVATTPTTAVTDSSHEFSWSIDLKGLPVTFYQGAFSTPDLANVTGIADNAIYVLCFRGSHTDAETPSFAADIYSRLLYTG